MNVKQSKLKEKNQLIFDNTFDCANRHKIHRSFRRMRIKCAKEDHIHMHYILAAIWISIDQLIEKCSNRWRVDERKTSNNQDNIAKMFNEFTDISHWNHVYAQL